MILRDLTACLGVALGLRKITAGKALGGCTGEGTSSAGTITITPAGTTCAGSTRRRTEGGGRRQLPREASRNRIARSGRTW